MYYGLGVCLALATFFAANALGSALVAALAAPLVPRLGEGAAGARRLLWLRLAPSLGALLCASAMAASYALFEPRAGHEIPGRLLASLSLGGACLIAAGALRGLAAWHVTHRLLHRWLRRSSPLALPGAPGSARLLRSRRPVVSIVGVWRPWTFVAGRVVEALSSQELEMAVAHEAGHHAASDNLKRLMLRSCPDLLAFTPVGRGLERAWAQAAETAADDHAASGDPQRGVELSSALIKVARLAAVGPRLVPVSALCGGDDVGRRVERLLLPQAAAPAAVWPREVWRFGLLLLPLLAAALPQLLALVHAGSELLVRVLR